MPEQTRSDSRALILHVALQLFSARGYDSTSIDDIRQAAGFKSKASLYTHFKSKEEVAIALIQQIMAALNQTMFRAYHEAKPEPLHQLTAIGRAFISWGLLHPQEHAFCFVRVQQDILLQGKASFYGADMQTPGRTLTRLITQLRQTQPVRAIADAALLSMFVGLISRAVIEQEAFGDLTHEQKVQQILEVCFAILFAQPVPIPD
ncbi:TetR family transcriptional regulator [Thermosporothrix hazakensis]|jgi:AcrR family transcriptional regulator|uniref:TetR family transcriptional regulator n=2 Tax=Thermosporothrix TaxID=768650 RepID=A0A326U6P4_THEHA|nr:TetR/AcrR family transcriptional regulator [Thermosporothrix hazakensis]PZW26136.1 TetR family transcriptional regulator [Thermosporothrix hazakensis]BBH87371.1 hypothetical protein KTC_21220 [Thermosporothrix sp. COM3]GCE51396.1 hypothetical protein KTH_62650 [Thermosporothrix hazakensis]